MTQFQNFWNSFESVLYIEGFPNGSVVKNPPGMQETRVQYLGQEDALEEEMATHSSIFARNISWMKETGGLQSTGSQKGRTWLITKLVRACWVASVMSDSL